MTPTDDIRSTLPGPWSWNPDHPAEAFYTHDLTKKRHSCAFSDGIVSTRGVVPLPVVLAVLSEGSALGATAADVCAWLDETAADLSKDGCDPPHPDDGSCESCTSLWLATDARRKFLDPPGDRGPTERRPSMDDGPITMRRYNGAEVDAFALVPETTDRARRGACAHCGLHHEDDGVRRNHAAYAHVGPRCPSGDGVGHWSPLEVHRACGDFIAGAKHEALHCAGEREPEKEGRLALDADGNSILGEDGASLWVDRVTYEDECTRTDTLRTKLATARSDLDEYEGMNLRSEWDKVQGELAEARGEAEPYRTSLRWFVDWADGAETKDVREVAERLTEARQLVGPTEAKSKLPPKEDGP